jgi:hypothetical protein
LRVCYDDSINSEVFSAKMKPDNRTMAVIMIAIELFLQAEQRELSEKTGK